MSLILFGIPNCDTVKKARTWLEARGVAYTFHDYKKDGILEAKIKTWLEQIDLDTLLNKKGTTFRQLTEKPTDLPSAIALMLEKPSVIKRPLVEQNGKIISVGFQVESWEKIF